MKEARKHAGLSQERLGVLAGIDEMSSSARMNQYERGKHEPDFSMVERIAKVLNVPESYFYAKDDQSAWLQVVFHRMPSAEREKVTLIWLLLSRDRNDPSPLPKAIFNCIQLG